MPCSVLAIHGVNLIGIQMLQGTKTEPSFSIEELARITVDFSGSDLRELCRNAAMVPVREYMRSSDTNQELLAKGQIEVLLSCLQLLL